MLAGQRTQQEKGPCRGGERSGTGTVYPYNIALHACRVEATGGERGAQGRKAQYPRRVAPSKDEQQGAAHAAYMARMAAHFAEVGRLPVLLQFLFL